MKRTPDRLLFDTGQFTVPGSSRLWMPSQPINGAFPQLYDVSGTGALILSLEVIDTLSTFTPHFYDRDGVNIGDPDNIYSGFDPGDGIPQMIVSGPNVLVVALRSRGPFLGVFFTTGASAANVRVRAWGYDPAALRFDGPYTPTGEGRVLAHTDSSGGVPQNLLPYAGPATMIQVPGAAGQSLAVSYEDVSGAFHTFAQQSLDTVAGSRNLFQTIWIPPNPCQINASVGSGYVVMAA